MSPAAARSGAVDRGTIGRSAVGRGVARSGVTARDRLPPERLSLVDLLDRLLAGGVVLTGDLVLSIADVDLICISLRTVIVSVDDLEGGA